MTRWRDTHSKPSVRAFARGEDGSTLVEFAIVLPVFLLLLFGLIDFGRMGFEYVMANKAVQMATRLAVTRPPACPGVATINMRGAVVVGAVLPIFGTNCRTAANVCANPGTVSCAGSTGNPTAAEIWSTVSALMPSGAAPSNLHFSYAYTSELGFLGGPYVPMVTVEIRDLDFQFVMPLAALAGVAGQSESGLPGSLPFPALSVTLPAEDLALGEAG